MEIIRVVHKMRHEITDEERAAAERTIDVVRLGQRTA